MVEPLPNPPTGADTTAQPELPLEGGARSGSPARQNGRRRSAARIGADAFPDLFADPPLEQPEPEPEPEPEAMVPAPVAAGPPAPNAARPGAGLVQRVDPRGLRPTDRTDPFLYAVLDAGSAEQAVRHGLPVEPDAPLLLTERPGVPFRLALHAEEMEAGPLPAVVRLRRLVLEGLLDPDPDASAGSGFPCWRLAGGR